MKEISSEPGEEKMTDMAKQVMAEIIGRKYTEKEDVQVIKVISDVLEKKLHNSTTEIFKPVTPSRVTEEVQVIGKEIRETATEIIEKITSRFTEEVQVVEKELLNTTTEVIKEVTPSFTDEVPTETSVKLLPEIVCGDILESGLGVIQTGDITSEILSQEKSHAAHQKDIIKSEQEVIQVGDITTEIMLQEKSLLVTDKNVTKSEQEVSRLGEATEIISQENSHAAHEDIIKSEQEVIQVLDITTEIISQEKSHVTDKNVTKSEEEVIGLGDTTEIISQEKSHATHQDIIKSEQELIQVGDITTEIMLQEKPPHVTDKNVTKSEQEIIRLGNRTEIISQEKSHVTDKNVTKPEEKVIGLGDTTEIISQEKSQKDIIKSEQEVIQVGDTTEIILKEKPLHVTDKNVTKPEEEVIGLGDTTEIISQEKSHATHQKDIIKSEQGVIQVGNITTEIILQEKPHVTDSDKNVTKSEQELIGVGDTTEIISQEKFHATHEDIIKSNREVTQVGDITEIILQEKSHVTDKNITKSEQEVIGLGDTTEIISQEKSHATHETIIKSEQEVIQVGDITTEIMLQEKPPHVTDKNVTKSEQEVIHPGDTTVIISQEKSDIHEGSYKSTAESTTRVTYVTVEVIPEDTEQVTARKSASDEVVHPIVQTVQDVAHDKMSPKNLIPEIISVDDITQSSGENVDQVPNITIQVTPDEENDVLNETTIVTENNLTAEIPSDGESEKQTDMDATATAQYEQAALTLLSLAFEKLKLNSTADLEETFLSCEDPQEACSYLIETDNQTNEMANKSELKLDASCVSENAENREMSDRLSASFTSNEINTTGETKETLDVTPFRSSKANTVDDSLVVQYDEIMAASPSLFAEKLPKYEKCSDFLLKINGLQQTISKLKLLNRLKEGEILKLKQNKFGPLETSEDQMLTNGKNESSESQLIEAQNKISELMSQNKKIEEKYEKEIHEVKVKLEEKEQKLQLLKENSAELEQKLTAAKDENKKSSEQWKEILDRSDKILVGFSKNLKEAEEKNNKMETKYNDLNIVLNSVIEKYEKCKQSIITLKTNEETYKNHIKALEKKFEQAADEYEKFKIKALAQIDEANKENLKLQQQPKKRLTGDISKRSYYRN
ncbi:putative leucine-rich repeat-containing protein DDB_G0290503 isoform X5 [Tenebrio molitor]|uniref:putative leucine-rich repeat-containing protein DDB_G0290503 isoform X5 n=1 Tax=Tenebrio molitor TaxID=7067 RepID=UPI003624791A